MSAATLSPKSLSEKDILNLYRLRGYFHEALQLRLKLEALKIPYTNPITHISPSMKHYSKSTQLLIQKIATDFGSNHELIKFLDSENAFAKDATLQQMHKILEEASAKPEHAEISSILQKNIDENIDYLKKNKAVANRFRKMAMFFGFTDSTTGLALKNTVRLVPPFNWVMPMVSQTVGLLNRSLEYMASKYDPNFMLPAERNKITPMSALGTFGTVAAISGIVMLGVGATVASVALAPIAFFAASAVALTNTIKSTVDNFKELYKEWKKTDPIKKISRPWRMLSQGLKCFTSLNGVAATILATSLAFAAITNPLGLAVAAVALTGYIGATIGLGVFSHFASKWAKKKGEQKEALALMQEKSATQSQGLSDELGTGNKPGVSQTMGLSNPLQKSPEMDLIKLRQQDSPDKDSRQTSSHLFAPLRSSREAHADSLGDRIAHPSTTPTKSITPDEEENLKLKEKGQTDLPKTSDIHVSKPGK